MSGYVEVKMDNDAFSEPAIELARILRDIADRIEGGEVMAFSLRDANGNTVGKFKVIGHRRGYHD